MSRFRRLLRSPWLRPLAVAAREVRNVIAGQQNPVRVMRRIAQHSGMRVLSGPFQGMMYGAESAGSALYPKLLGTYELELHPIIQRLVHGYYRTVIDVGCAEGYYTTGLLYARRLHSRPMPRVIGFDTNPAAVAMARCMLELNSLQDFCELVEGSFNGCGVFEPPCMIVCDIEGAEADVLDPEKDAGLRIAEILVEVHEAPGSDVLLRDLASRFAQTHLVQPVYRRDRTVDDFPRSRLGRVGARCMLRMMDERRLFGNAWLHMTPVKQAIGNPVET